MIPRSLVSLLVHFMHERTLHVRICSPLQLSKPINFEAVAVALVHYSIGFRCPQPDEKHAFVSILNEGYKRISLYLLPRSKTTAALVKQCISDLSISAEPRSKMTFWLLHIPCTGSLTYRTQADGPMYSSHWLRIVLIMGQLSSNGFLQLVVREWKYSSAPLL